MNPVNVIRRRLGTLVGNTSFAALYGGTGGTAGADATWPGSTSCVKKLNPNSTLGVMSQEIVAEFAVDFRVGVQGGQRLTAPWRSMPLDTRNIPRALLGQSAARPSDASEQRPTADSTLEPLPAIRSRVPDRVKPASAAASTGSAHDGQRRRCGVRLRPSANAAVVHHDPQHEESSVERCAFLPFQASPRRTSGRGRTRQRGAAVFVVMMAILLLFGDGRLVHAFGFARRSGERLRRKSA